MGVYIKDMEMPMVCGACPLAYDFSYCMASQEPLGKLNLDTRHPKCPLIPVPDYPVKHGKWIPHPTEPDWDVCSVCGIGTHIRFHYNEGVYGGYDVEESYSYCPHCGAKTDKGDEDE